MTDILLKQTADGGELTIQNGTLLMSDGLETAAYLSLFGSNDADSGLAADDANQFWGNLIDADPVQKQRSQTQYLLGKLPLTPANLQRFEEAAAADLAWFKGSIADSIAVQATLPGINKIQFNVVIIINGVATSLRLTPPNAST